VSSGTSASRVRPLMVSFAMGIPSRVFCYHGTGRCLQVTRHGSRLVGASVSQRSTPAYADFNRSNREYRCEAGTSLGRAD
jgi:hypothetical protein